MVRNRGKGQLKYLENLSFLTASTKDAKNEETFMFRSTGSRKFTSVLKKPWPRFGCYLAELGTRHFFSFAPTPTRQRNRTSRTSQGSEKIRKIVSPQCLDGVATTNIVKWQFQAILCPENMVTLSRQNCRVPSSENTYMPLSYISVSTLPHCKNQCCGTEII